jgi:preprotein translocase subunit SecF
LEFIKSGTQVNFLSKGRAALIISAVVILAGLISLIAKGGPNYGIDFTGGTLVQLKFSNPVSVKEVRAGIKPIGLGDSVIQQFGSNDEIVVRMGVATGELEDIGRTLRAQLLKAMPGQKIEVRRTELVGPKVGKDLREKAVLAIIVALFAIVGYISWRFEFRFAIAAIVALIHDIVVTVGVFSIMDKEFTLPIIAALLTIVGYSLNDTIVVFDRVRENLKARRKGTVQDILNKSINETLSRTILTSLTTLFVVLVLTLFGGEVIHDFAFALVIGVIVGTYSSIFIASPLLAMWQPTSRTGRSRLAAARRR